MAISNWQNWTRTLGLASTPAKRVVSEHRWVSGSERLESRALLSATSIAAAEVSLGKAAVEAPDVAGDWELSLPGLGSGTADVSQNGNKLRAVISVGEYPDFEVNGKFNKKNPTSISDKVKIKTPNGKITVDINIEFGESESPNTFTGEVTVLGETSPITGTRLANAPAVAKAVEYPDITGQWSLDVTGEVIDITEAELTFEQLKNGKIAVGNAEFDGGTVSFKGKFKPNSTELKGKATVVLGGETFAKNKFSIVFFEEFTTFTGQAEIKKTGEIVDLDGDLNIG